MEDREDLRGLIVPTSTLLDSVFQNSGSEYVPSFQLEKQGMGKPKVASRVQ